MDGKFVLLLCIAQFFWLIEGFRLGGFGENEFVEDNRERGCAYLHCEGNDVCVHRKFRCKQPPCPSMLYCAKSQTELVKGPSTCDSVQCATGYLCTLKVRRCHWDYKCEQQVARCVSRKVYFEGPASCAGFKCPQGSHCVLRESFCADPPCKLIRSCARNKDVHLLFARCRSLGCPSEFECFLRKPDRDCSHPPCRHTPDCLATNDSEPANPENCTGWICPEGKTCVAEAAEFCETADCDVKRTCRDLRHVDTNDTLSFPRKSPKKEQQEEEEEEESLVNKTASLKTEEPSTVSTEVLKNDPTEANLQEDLTALSEHEKSIDDARFVDDAHLELLEELIKSQHRSMDENLPMVLDGKRIRQQGEDIGMNLFLDRNADEAFGYALIETLIELANEQNESVDVKNSPRNPDETSTIDFLANGFNDSPRAAEIADERSDRFPFSTIDPSDADKTEYHRSRIHDRSDGNGAGFFVGGRSNEEHSDGYQVEENPSDGNFEREKYSRTPGLFEADEEPARNFYDPPSFGANDASIPRDFVYQWFDRDDFDAFINQSSRDY